MPRAHQLKEGADRRLSARLSCKAPVRIYADSSSIAESFMLESANLSQDGVYLRTDYLYPVGEWLDLEFMIPGRALIVRGRGRVVRVDLNHDPPGPGIAVHIPQMCQADRSAIHNLRFAMSEVEPGVVLS